MPSSPALDLDTFLVAVYCAVDDLYRAELAGVKPIRPGHRFAVYLNHYFGRPPYAFVDPLS